MQHIGMLKTGCFGERQGLPSTNLAYHELKSIIVIIVITTTIILIVIIIDITFVIIMIINIIIIVIIIIIAIIIIITTIIVVVIIVSVVIISVWWADLGVDCSRVDSPRQQAHPDCHAKHGAGCAVIEDSIQHRGSKQHCHYYCPCYAVIPQGQEEKQGGEACEADS